ncbi:hypothetical protein AYO21_10612 [Fonsecaea monophora]|uniref:DUF1446-domain-containing protein n=1 Tax=Fonsecaea monophora TaxID=254056 RepID=A0A177ET80_9EURO|nr:hypothetical protein AYO21_10612 [Fonsecaea monophora]OAG35214.1 hypothetical protein AYO21_10612 [Fonsecaea monophora]
MLKQKDSSRPIAVAGASGGALDRFRGLTDLSKLPEIDVIVGDWMSEANMTMRGVEVAELKKKKAKLDGQVGTVSEVNGDSTSELGFLSRSRGGYDPYFLEQLEPALENLAANGIRLACNSGGSNPRGLAEAVKSLVSAKGLKLDVAWVDGDDVSDVTLDLWAKGERFPGLPTGKDIQDWPFDPLCAQCYLGGVGVAKAFESGAAIVICGRIADASALVGACMWWFNWQRETHIQELAGALVAGHLTECSTYVTGGCYAGFKEFGTKDVDLSFPIAWIESNGEFELGMEPGHDGKVTVDTAVTQLLYEIQGPLYFNSDVVANLEGVQMQQIGPNRVRVTGVEGLPPPPTTKVGITARGGYRAQFHYYLTGLDVDEKAAVVERQTRHMMGENLPKFHCLSFNLAGRPAINPRNQNEATVDYRIFAQSRDKDVMNMFGTWCKSNILQSYPGGTPHTDVRTSLPKPYFEYWVSLLPQEKVHHQVHLADGSSVTIPPPQLTRVYPTQQKSYDTPHPVPLDTFGATENCPLGYRVLGRSGDKSSDANVGLFVRHDDEWEWLRSFLTIDKVKELLGEDYVGKPIDRFEIPALRAVHFLLRDHLDRGYNSSSGFDTLGKNVVEYLRAKYVDIPVTFLQRGRI